MCAASHGIERTGLFCAMMNMMDQLVTDNEVDVYDAVKRVRQARPEFIDSIVFIYFIYSVYLSIYLFIIKVAQKYTVRKSTAIAEDRRTHDVLLVSSCYVSRAVKRFHIAKVTFKVIRGHWQWCHSIGNIQFPISRLLQLCLYLAPFPRYYQLFSKT